MDYSVLLIIILGAFGALILIQAYRLYSINREWGFGEIVIRWISPEEKKAILYIIIALIALIIAIYIRSEALLSAITALLIAFGGMLSQLTFINVIGKRGIYLGRTRKGFTWDEVEKLVLTQRGNEYKLEITVLRKKRTPNMTGFIQRIQEELDSLDKLDEPRTTADVKTRHTDADEKRIAVEDPLAKEQAHRAKIEQKKRQRLGENKNKKSKEQTEEELERSTHSISFTEKHQFQVQQALMYYFSKGVEYRMPEEITPKSIDV